MKKEQKHYHYDWNVVTNIGNRFENIVASHLLKWVDFEVDTKGRELELRYFRDDAGREVDFVITEHGDPIKLIEVKTGEPEIGRGLRYLKERFPKTQAWVISLESSKEFRTPDGIHAGPAVKFLRGLV